MTPPDFWQKKNLISHCLLPLGWLYDGLGKLRCAITRPAPAPCPVICVGNLNIGGTGKTPVVAALAEALIQQGQKVHILSRGYGGRLSTREPLRVDAARHTAAEVGDEPLLLSRHAPVWIGRDRVRAAQAAEGAGATLLMMDDGFQNPTLTKDFSIVVIDAGVGFGNGRIIPAGPLRETIDKGVARADLIVSIGSDAPPPETAGRPILRAQFSPCPTAVQQLRRRKVLAFCGIGRPEKFYHSLHSIGAEVVETQSFPDHYLYRPADLARLRQRAQQKGLALVTTEKDKVRLDSDAQQALLCLPVRLVWDNPDAFQDLLSTLTTLRSNASCQKPRKTA